MSNSKQDIERKKKQVIEKLKTGEFIAILEPPSSSHGSFWQHLLRIKCLNNEYQPFVQCQLCYEILSYSISNGTSTISYHVKNCLNKSSVLKSNKTIDSYVSKNTEVNVTVDDKRSITVACAKFCSFDMRPFSIVKGQGFTNLCQNLINIGYQYGTTKSGPPSASSVLPDPTNVSRTVSQISEEYREQLKNILKVDLQGVKLIGISTDYWKNSGTSENYLTVNIHYSKNEKNVTYMLRTSLFDQSKTGDNTRKKFFSILSSYGIDPNEYHIVYITDNGSNLICAFHMCVHFKRCEMNQLLQTSLKLNVDTRWNSIHDMLESISFNFQKCEDVLLDRNESYYLNEINRKLLLDLVKFLFLFKVASEQLSADTSPTLHLVVPWFTKLKNSCEIEEGDHLLLVQFKNAVSRMLDEKIYLTSLHYIATFLYPATKKFLTLSSSFRDEIYSDTRKMIQTIGIQQEHSTVSSTKQTNIANKTSKKKKTNLVIQKDVMQEFAGVEEEDFDDDSDEIDRYINTKLSFSSDDTLLGWWNKHSLIFPQLALLAKSLLGVPASSATSERVFSSSGRILEKRRQYLKPDIVDDILMIRNFRDV
ncbi:unnamed protein product [Rotaria sordida]|uniref:Transposase n=1 Tax=Rotaria sordida TaxID=392033 RepID=A0A814FLI4_9BILA|nr:unnamed protein product [Rotaria sordida]CAF1284025.1 unnamed protein product [Rotaria sordida]